MVGIQIRLAYLEDAAAEAVDPGQAMQRPRAVDLHPKGLVAEQDQMLFPAEPEVAEWEQSGKAYQMPIIKVGMEASGFSMIFLGRQHITPVEGAAV